tara:strand:- start:1013 stop:1240 length:228 start_codon:yes stop_codon:yes gene_type:complete
MNKPNPLDCTSNMGYKKAFRYENEFVTDPGDPDCGMLIKNAAFWERCYWVAIEYQCKRKHIFPLWLRRLLNAKAK